MNKMKVRSKHEDIIWSIIQVSNEHFLMFMTPESMWHLKFVNKTFYKVINNQMLLKHGRATRSCLPYEVHTYIDDMKHVATVVNNWMYLRDIRNPSGF